MTATVKNCRVCGAPLGRTPLVSFKGMPKAAQFLPSAGELSREKGVALNVLQCGGCGLVQLDSAPVPYYREVIRAAAFSPEMGAFRRKQFVSFVKRYGLKGKRVLELGCGRGEYLRLMRDAGADAVGLEYSSASVNACRAAGLKVFKGLPEKTSARLPGGPYAAFFILNFLEHLPDPNALLSAMCANLAPGGVGLVEVPDFDMMLSRSLFSEFIPDHLFYFTRPALKTLLEINGFEVLDTGTVWHGYILSAVVRRRERLDLRAFSASRAKLASALCKFISRFPKGRVAVWGAGHQALAVLALSGLGGHIRYVVDSAPFKQGKYTPATHIPIVPPSRLKEDPVDAVIVMAASYSEEVDGILRRDFGDKVKTAILRENGLEVRSK